MLCRKEVEGQVETVCNLWNRRWTTELLGELLVLMTGLLLFAMPITEYFCDWDRFLRGGVDVEFSILAWLLFAAMLVLTMNGTILQPRWLKARRTLARSVGARRSGERSRIGFPVHPEERSGFRRFSPLRI